MSGCRTMVLVAAGALLAGCAPTVPLPVPKDVVEVEGVAHMGEKDTLEDVKKRAEEDAINKAARKAFGLHVEAKVETDVGILVKDTTTRRVVGTFTSIDIVDEGLDKKHLRYHYRIRAKPGAAPPAASEPMDGNVSDSASDKLNEPSILDSREERVPDAKYPTPDEVVQALESQVTELLKPGGRLSEDGKHLILKKYRLLVGPFEVVSEPKRVPLKLPDGSVVSGRVLGTSQLPKSFGEELLDCWMPAFVKSRLFDVYPPANVIYDGRLRGKIRDRDGHIEVHLDILASPFHKNRGQIVASERIPIQRRPGCTGDEGGPRRP